MNVGDDDDDAAPEADMIAPRPPVRARIDFKPPAAALLLIPRTADTPEKEDIRAPKEIDRARTKPLIGGQQGIDRRTAVKCLVCGVIWVVWGHT